MSNLGTVGEGGVAAVHASNSEGVVFANDIVRALLVVRHQVAVGEMVAGQALVAGDSSTLENRFEGGVAADPYGPRWEPNPWWH